MVELHNGLQLPTHSSASAVAFLAAISSATASPASFLRVKGRYLQNKKVKGQEVLHVCVCKPSLYCTVTVAGYIIIIDHKT